MADTKKPTPKTEKKPVAGKLSVALYDKAGKTARQVELAPELFGQPVNKAVLATYVKVYLTNQRQGTASTKTRSFVKMTSKKMYRQKGTGRARHGAANAPLFVGGGIAFGPQPKVYSKDLNKKQKKIAIVSALSDAYARKVVAALDDAVVGIDPKTATVAALLKAIEAPKSVLLVLPKIEKAGVVLAARNIPGVTIMDARSVNAYEVMKAKKVLFTEGALSVAAEHFARKEEVKKPVEKATK